VRLDVAFTPAEVRGTATRHTVVVIDVLRATSTIIHALVNGARSVVPVASVEDAARKADQIGRDAVLLCGERDSEPIRGFQLGNAPEEFTAERVGGKTLIMTTTNGTPALLAAHGAERVYVGALINLSAVARRIVEEADDALLLCSGRDGAFALEDALCAGRIVQRIREANGGVTGNDAAAAALRLAAQPATARTLARTAAGRRLREIGRGADVVFCAREDVHDAVPLLDGHRITLQEVIA
jgi:2-phosphosulfolactate phosphatase